MLRSKQVSTGQIYDIVSQFDGLSLYFPNKEIFVLELLIDRWNDQKQIQFKTDYKIWQLFNRMWVAVGDELTLKKLSKRLRFVPHLIRTLELVDSNTLEFLRSLKQTCALMNSIITMNVSIENATSILGKTLTLVSQLDENYSFRKDLFEEIETLTDLRNIPETSTKVSNSYCDEALLPSLKYITKFSSDNYDLTVERLTKLLQFFVFSPSVDTVKLLDRFVSAFGEKLNAEEISTLFESSIEFLSKENFLQLEKVFTIVVKVHPDLSSKLLKELSLSKKTMSQEFLEGLFDKALIGFSQQAGQPTIWQLIFYIIELDIEVGIKNTDRILDLVKSQIDQNSDWCVKLWTQLILCHTAARELPQFLEKLELYCRRDGGSAHPLLTDRKFTDAVSSSVTSFSTSQYKDEISRLLDALEKDSEDLTSALLLKILLRDLRDLPVASLKDLKEPLKRVFKLRTLNESQLWQIRYLIMEVFEDILPDEILESSGEEIQTSILNKDSPIELLFYFLKLREYKSYDITPVFDFLIGQLDQSTKEQQSQILLEVFSNWGTMINSLLPNGTTRRLVDLLCADSNFNILSDLFDEDDIFEESNIIRLIISKLFDSYQNKGVAELILRVPIQCISKTARIELINRISDSGLSKETETRLMMHLLANPTFKSKVESSWEELEKFMVRDAKQLNYEQPIFEKIWSNHLSQTKEAISQVFLRDGIDRLKAELEGQNPDMAYLKMVFLVLKVGGEIEFEELKEMYYQRVLEIVTDENFGRKDALTSSWLLRTLFYVIEHDKVETSRFIPALSGLIKNLGGSVKEADKDLLASIFLLYSALYRDRIEYLFAHYMVLREVGVASNLLKPGLDLAVRKSLEHNVGSFNSALHFTIESFESCTACYADSLLELYQTQVEYLTKENTDGCRLFARSLSSLYTNTSRFEGSRDNILRTLESINGFLISKSWLFSQYSIEMLFPMCLKLSLSYIKCSGGADDVFTATTKLVSTVLFNHRVKLSNRHHLVIAFISEYLELLSNYKVTGLSNRSSRSLSRLIINFCEPISGTAKQTNGKDVLSSKVGILKASLRKHVPVLLIKYVHLSINAPFEQKSRAELATAMYSVFDLLSPNELGLVNAALDNSGRHYLKGLYADYRKTGKWNAD